ncbi:MAG: lysophospholipase [Candidatus Eremiobacteraeota bacterium]|nr:lysophospholipase [Candidatus Eremiobacteraeota bacterium]
MRVRRVLRWSTIAFAALVAVAVIALAIGAPVPIGDAQLLFPPQRPPLAAWNRPGVETFSVRAADGTMLRGWILRGRRDAPWLLIDYGNASSMENMFPLATWFVRRLGYTTVMWDYRGYEFSGGRIDALASRDDALRVYDAVRAHSRSVPFVYGLSYGTTIAVHMAASRPVRGLVLHAPPSDATTEVFAVRDGFVPWPVRRLRPVPTRSLRIALDEAHEIARVTAPLIVLHGNADALIPISQGRAVERAAGSRDKRFIVLPGARHGDVFYANTPAGDAIAAFLAAR